MIISGPHDFRRAAQRRLPRFLFDYIDGGSFAEDTLARNIKDLQNLSLRPRVLSGQEPTDLSVSLFGQDWTIPVGLSPVGMTGMFARRGEVQAARAAAGFGVPYTLSTVSICPINEVAAKVDAPIWFQLYVLKDRAFMAHALEEAKAHGIKSLVFTVDLPVGGLRYRDERSGLAGPFANTRRILQAMTRPRWAWSVGIMGRPHAPGNIAHFEKKKSGLTAYQRRVGDGFDPTISWSDLEWLRDNWDGPLILKGIMDPADIPDAIKLGADGIIVSNHGGRQLDGSPSSVAALPEIIEAVDGRAKVLLDGGIRSGLDVVKALCLGADAVMIGRSYIYALAARGEKGVAQLLAMYEKEMRVAMTLTGAKTIADLDRSRLADMG